jgi:hypothetical protein
MLPNCSPRSGRGADPRPECSDLLVKIGAGDGTRTRDLLITNQLLYQLSYAGVLAGQAPLSERPESRILAWPRRRILTDAPWGSV